MSERIDEVELFREKRSLHVLDGLDVFTPRARAFLLRAAWRVEPPARCITTEMARVRTSSGRQIPAPIELVIRREGFAQKYAGLRYRVRRSVLFPRHGRFDSEATWEFDLGPTLRAERRGWSFDWSGERVASPFWHLAHSDGRIGVGDGGPFLEIAPSMCHLIESHAVMDEVAPWDPYSGLTGADAELAASIDGLVEVPEASGPMGAWWKSDTVAVHTFRNWTSEGPRLPRAWIWTLGEEGRRSVAKLEARS